MSSMVRQWRRSCTQTRAVEATWTGSRLPHIVRGSVSGETRVARRFIVMKGFAAIALLAGIVPRVASAQHITIDGRLSSAQTLVGPTYTIGANLGKQVGSNLFHSFGQFNLSSTPVPESATFTSTGNTGPISNVIGRVTGGNQSTINGAIISAVPGANLYLINPSGIVFRAHATVNISGSFHPRPPTT